KGGTNIVEVIDRAMEVLGNAANHKILIIVTDGENLEGDAIEAAEKAAAKGLTIHAVGVGTEQGELIPLGGTGDKGFVKDPTGNFVTSRLDEKTLSAIAEKSGGLYAPLGAGEGLETIYRQKLALIPKEELAERRHKVPIERFEWPLALAAVVLIAEMLIGERKKTRPVPLREALRRLMKRKAQVMVLFLLLVPFFGTRSYGADGEDAYRRGDYLAASEYFGKLLEKSPNNAQLQYNYGTAAYKNNMYDAAIEAFNKALQSEDIELQKKAYYNRGNSHYRKGAEVRQADPQAAADQWRQALTSLQSVLELNPADEDATYNKELVTKQLAQLEEELKRQKQQQADKQEESGKEERQSGQPQSSPEENDSEKDKSDEAASQPEDKPEEQSGGEGQKQDKTKDEEGQIATADQTDPQEATPAEQSAKDAERRQLGKMTKEEAERMLNALKQEEGELNFVPSGRAMDKPERDW
ncbi:MAG TPA: hypothetical protein DDY32_14120, partial [Desulfobulbaceae bacterium]|nr:hypothetical protein [Desulfobulbaceae bacterium]